MSAVKRVQKLLLHAERRSLESFRAENDKAIYKSNKKGNVQKQQQQQQQQTQGQGQGQEVDKENSNQEREYIFVKATGKAMEKALGIGKWFESKPDEYVIRVRTGSVLVVDDIVEDEEKKMALISESEHQKQQDNQDQRGHNNDMNFNTSESSSSPSPSQPQPSSGISTSLAEPSTSCISAPTSAFTQSNGMTVREESKSKKGKKRKRDTISMDSELPESRIRWVNMVEVAVGIK